MSKKDFLKGIHVDIKQNAHEPNFKDIASKEHSLWIQEEVNNNRKQLVHRLAYNIKAAAQFFDSINYTYNIEYYGFGRVKSKASIQNNIVHDKNLLDVLGITFVVKQISSEYSSAECLDKALNMISRSSNSEKLLELTGPLEKILEILNTTNSKIKTEKDDYFEVDMYGRHQKFKNVEVLLVMGINQFIAKANKMSTSDFSNKSEVHKMLRKSKSATNFGISIDLHNEFIAYMKNSADLVDINKYNRYKPVQNTDGYVAYHIGVHDSLARLPVECKFMTEENLYIAEYGTASHQTRVGKARKLEMPEINTSQMPAKQISALTNLFGDEKRVEQMLNPIPDITTFSTDKKIHICNNWENFHKYYEKQLGAMSEEERHLYYVGLQLVPELRGHLDAEFYSKKNSNKFPYNLLPTINKINELTDVR